MTLMQNVQEIALPSTPVIIWSLVWKGIALWKAGRHNQKYWFIAILLIQTIGLLEIVYLLWFQRDRPNK